MTASKHSVSVAGAVVNNDGRLLAIRRRDNGHWEPPGGVLEVGETLDEGLRREVLEETGLQVEPVALTGIYQNLPRGIVAFVFRCEPTGGQLGLTAETSDARWLSATEIEAHLDEAYAVRLLDALAWAPGSEPTVRSHDGIHLLTSR